MALGRLGLCRLSVLHHESFRRVFCAVLLPGCFERCVGAKRHLLSEDVIKLQKFQEVKLGLSRHVIGSQGNYVMMINQKVQRKEAILHNELKLLLHLCQSAGDVETARDAIYWYHADSRNLVRRDYRFGPLFVRLCYELGLEEMAAATLTDKRMKGFFKDSTSFNIVIDMLFTKGSYKSALKVLRTMKKQGVSFDILTYTLAAATYYKLNTPESFDICTALMDEALSKGFHVTHANCFAVALALRQNNIGKVQSLCLQIMITNTKICLNLKVVLLARLGAISDAISVLSAAMMPNSPLFVKKPEFSQEVMDLLRLQSEAGPHRTQVEQIVSQLVLAGQVTQQTLDDMLCHTPIGRTTKAGILQEGTFSPRSRNTLQSKLLLD